jgi:hypothetical protein
VVESDDVAYGLVDVISEHNVSMLVMGAADDKHYTKKMKVLKSRKARVVEQHADHFCKIWFICKGTLVYCRYGCKLIIHFTLFLHYGLSSLHPFAFTMFSSFVFSTLGRLLPLAMM